MSALSLAQAKKHLNIVNETSNDELQTFIDAAEAILTTYCGPLVPTEVTASVVCTDGVLVLPVAPIVEMGALSSAGSPVELEGAVVDLASGVVRWRSPWGTTWSSELYEVTYTAGRAELPADLLMAVKEMTRHLWRTQRGGAQRPGAAADGAAPGYLVPNMVAALIEPHQIRVGVT